MELRDLLSELRENILHDRSDRVAGADDVLWSDATLIRYIDEAQRRFARRALVLRDGRTTEATQVALVEGQTEYDLHPSVLAVISAKLSTDEGDLARMGHSEFDAYRPHDTRIWDPATLISMTPGKPLAYSLDEGVSYDDNESYGVARMRVYPEPSADYEGAIIQMRVIRMPIEPLTPANLGAHPELPAEHHLEMLDWAAYLALRIVDRDAGDANRAKEFAASFEAHVMEARRNAERKMHAPQKWGFGRNGWSW